MRYFLSLEISWSKSEISENMLLNFSMTLGLIGSKPANTPFDPSIKLQAYHNKTFPDVVGYGRLDGRHLYDTITRRDNVYSLKQLSQFMLNPLGIHYKVVV